MRILTLSNCPLVETQGSGYIILNFCRGLRSKGHIVDLFGPESFEPIQILREKGKAYQQAIGMLFLAFRQLAKENYDIVEFYGAESWLSVLILNRIPKRKLLLVSHSNGLETHCAEYLLKYLKASTLDGLPPKWYQIDKSFLNKPAFTKVDGIVTVSFFDKKYALEENYQKQDAVVTIENSLPEDFLGLSPDFQRNTVIGFCGSWILRKGIKTIQADISRILIEFPEASFKIIGVGENFHKEQFFPSEICSQIEVVPFVSDKEKLKILYQTMSILILPSVYESFGLVVAEAMACGSAVVASKTGFSADLIHREEIFLMEEPTSPNLYQGVRELLSDEPLRLKIARAGHKRVQALRWETAVNKLERTYEHWLSDLRRNDKSHISHKDTV